MRVAIALGWATACCALNAVAATPLSRDKVPEPLKPWTDWVLRGKEAQLCPFLQGEADARHCAWPSRLQLTLDAKGGRFTQQWYVAQELWVPLPGQQKLWPQEVKADGAAAVVAEYGDAPSVLLKPGEHRLEGSFAWDTLPDSLPIPQETGLLSLTVAGRAVAFPNRDESGRVWLQKQDEEEKAENRTEVTVHRKVVDEIPLEVTTHVELQVAGKNREEVLGKALLEGFVPMSLDSPLPARLEPDGRLRVQLRPGHYVIEISGRGVGPVDTLALKDPGGPWSPEEVWVFESRTALRLVTVEGVNAVDPQQTTLPDAWKNFPAYRMKPGEAMRFDTKRRGDADPAPDHLTLQRDLWLDFDGAGYSVRDAIQGTLNRSSRLEMTGAIKLGRVAVGGRDQLITRQSPTASAGVEIRQGTVQATADSRIDSAGGALPAIGWDQDFHQVSGTLHLPPGWRLFSATGVDEVPGTWFRTWTLLDLFLALIIAMAVGRLWGKGWGAVAVVAMALTFTEPGAPQFAWLAVLAPEALTRVLPKGRLSRLMRLMRLGAWVVLVIVLVPFCIQQVRHGLYPALELTNGHSSDGFAFAAARDPEQERFAKVDMPAASRPAEASVSLDEMAKEDGDVGGEVNVMAKRALKKASPKPAGPSAVRSGYYQEVDPNAMVQTGPGLPQWTWRQFALRWNGPVQRTQQLRLFLMPPGLNLALGVLRVLLLAGLLVCLLGIATRWIPTARAGRAMGAALVFCLALAHPTRARAADFPPDEVLEALRERLLAKPDCSPHCASSSRLRLDITALGIQARMEISAAASTAIPLPGAAQQWVPTQVLLDNVPAQEVKRLADGYLWLAVGPGTHQVQIEGALPDRETVQLALPLKPHRVEAHVSGWTLEGLHEDGLADDDLQLTRVRREQGGHSLASLQQGTLPPFVEVDRTLMLGLRWEATTRVARRTPRGAAVVLEVPLLPGESVTSADVRVEGNKALVNMGPQVSELSWTSVLDAQPSLKLVAPSSSAWAEVWQLSASPVLHVEPSGLAPVHQQDASGNRMPQWRPWPGESVELKVTRPAGVPGQTLTVDQAQLIQTPGQRATDSSLSLTLRSSRGAQHILTLPEGAELQSVSINGATQPIRQEKQQVRLPIVPGTQRVQLSWREARGVSTGFVSSEVDIGHPASNVDVQVTVPHDRWILWVSGPRLGPAVLFWSLLVVLLLIAYGLSRIGLAPLPWHQWLLLGLGLSQVPVVAAAIVAGWLLALGWRKKSAGTLGNKSFDLFQLALVAWTVTALIILFVAIHQGLLGTPDMQIQGNGSGYGSLRWYQDRSAGTLPQAWVLSVPLIIYRLAMLAWALWLALALLKWLRWAWTAFTDGGAWRQFFDPPKPPTTAPKPKTS